MLQINRTLQEELNKTLDKDNKTLDKIRVDNSRN